MKRKQLSEKQIIVILKEAELPHSSLGYATPTAFADELEK